MYYLSFFLATKTTSTPVEAFMAFFLLIFLLLGGLIKRIFKLFFKKLEPCPSCGRTQNLLEKSQPITIGLAFFKYVQDEEEKEKLLQLGAGKAFLNWLYCQECEQNYDGSISYYQDTGKVEKQENLRPVMTKFLGNINVSEESDKMKKLRKKFE